MYGPLKEQSVSHNEMMCYDRIAGWEQRKLRGNSQLHYAVREYSMKDIANGLSRPVPEPKMSTKELILHWTSKEGRNIHVITECKSDGVNIQGKGLIKTILATIREKSNKIVIEKSNSSTFIQKVIDTWWNEDSAVWATSPKYMEGMTLNEFVGRIQRQQGERRQILLIFPKHLGITEEELKAVPYNQHVKLLIL